MEDGARHEKERDSANNVCHASLFLAFIKDAKDEPEDDEFKVPLKEKVKRPLDKPLEEGDCIWATGLFSEAEQIRATALISQRLEEGF